MQKNILKRFIAMLLALVMLASLAACGAKEPAVSETDTAVDYSVGSMVVDGKFDNADALTWMTYTESEGEGTVAVKDGKLVVDVTNPGKLSWAVQVYYDGISLKKGCEYVFQFDMSSSLDGKTVDAMIQYNGGSYDRYVTQVVTLSPEMQTFTLPFTMKKESDPAPRLCFNCGRADEGAEVTQEFQPYTITIDNVYVTCTKVAEGGADDKESLSQINLNQLGFRPDDTKTAILRGATGGGKYEIINSDGEVVYDGKIDSGSKNYTADETDWYINFTGFKEPGEYRITTEKFGDSEIFRIGDDVYDEAFDAVVKMLCLQRCGCELDADCAGEYAHPVCHDGEAIIYGTDETMDASGGWHDAGDYGRYVVSGAKAVEDIILAYEDAPEAFGDDAGIPESGNGIPDVLDEARWELDWMLKMQAADGGVYHKVTCLNFPGEVMPEMETEQLYVCPVSNTATGDFAAVMARASAVYADIDKDFSAACLDAALKAWDYLEATPFDGVGFLNPSDVATGEYPDAQDLDERFWAACELFSVTGDAKYSAAAEKIFKDVAATLEDEDEENDLAIDGLGWAQVGTYGTYAYLSADESKADADFRALLLDDLTTRANALCTGSRSDGYHISLGGDYFWGSNMGVMNNAMIMLFANKFAPNDNYTRFATEHMNYIFGANPTGYSYVTGFGANSPVHVHHRPSQAQDSPMPGMMVGGPNCYLEDPYAAKVLADKPVAMCYVDNEQSYSCNEICVYWNSPLIYVMAVRAQ